MIGLFEGYLICQRCSIGCALCNTPQRNQYSLPPLYAVFRKPSGVMADPIPNLSNSQIIREILAQDKYEKRKTPRITGETAHNETSLKPRITEEDCSEKLLRSTGKYPNWCLMSLHGASIAVNRQEEGHWAWKRKIPR